jgi:hypothetical protein
MHEVSERIGAAVRRPAAPGNAPMTRAGWLNLLAGTLIVAGVARIAAVYPVYTQTFDEPTHLAGGIEAIEKRSYRFESLQPPLSRTLIGIGPYLAGTRLRGQTEELAAGNAMLYDQGPYWRTLTLARMGILPFFIAAAMALFLWTRATFGGETAVFSLLLFTTLPPVLAHAGLATMDMAVTAMLFTAVIAFGWWLEAPSWRRSIVAGVALALALLAKMSTVVLFPLCALSYVASDVLSRRLAVARAGGLARVQRPSVSRWIAYSVALAGAAVLGVWAGYRFTMHPLLEGQPNEAFIRATLDRVVGSGGPIHRAAYAIARFPYFPAPEFVLGVGAAAYETATGRPAYLLGQMRDGGWWYFFPLALAVKTPLAFLLLVAGGLMGVLRNPRLPGRRDVMAIGLSACAILVVSFGTKIQIGLRHVLPIYPFLTVVAALGAAELWRRARGRSAARAVVVLLCGWQIVSGIRAHPDYLPYFNEIASGNPRHFLLDSDLDWGQDLDRLGVELERRGIDTVHIAYWGTARPERHLAAVPVPLTDSVRPHGWVAISMFPRYGVAADHFRFLDTAQRVTVVGKSIELYFVSDSASRAGATLDSFRK